ncbi:hypothetical protein [Aeoliella sp.]|uniref:hypothetical protein n=1 Tax=Aeoliella sp. TaxID=2795800 RepID=UPI003CCB9A5C
MIQFSIKDLLLLTAYVVGGMMIYSLLVLVMKASLDVDQMGPRFDNAAISIRLAGAFIGAMLWAVVHLTERLR